MDLPASNGFDRMVKIELDAAEALAGLARVSGSLDHEQRVNDDSSSGNNAAYEVANKALVKSPEISGISTVKSVKDKHSTASSGKKSRQNLTEAEVEARKIRRVLANRESARQTIRRRQAVFEELTRKAIDLSWENENLKKEKDTASKHFDSLKAKNQCLKAQMKIMNNEARKSREESVVAMNEPCRSTSSTNSPSFNYIQPSLVPIVWPNALQLHSTCEGSTSLFLLPYPCLFTIPQSGNNENNHGDSFNLNDKPKESCECQQFFPVKKNEDNFPPDGGGRMATTTINNPVSCEELVMEHDDTNKVGDHNKQQVVGEVNKIHQLPGERLGDTAAAAEARRRRKQLTRMKNIFHCRQLRMH